MAVFLANFKRADGRTGVAIVVAGTEIAAQMMLVNDRAEHGERVVVGPIVNLDEASNGVELVVLDEDTEAA